MSWFKPSKALVQLALFTVFIFIWAQFIQHWLVVFELDAFFISFCAGFILFVPLVSLTLHPLALAMLPPRQSQQKNSFWPSLGLTLIVQLLCFIIWITDALAIYSLYVDANSFLAQAFNISSSNFTSYSSEFIILNYALALLFAWLAIVIGILPSLVARAKGSTVVVSFVTSFGIFKRAPLLILALATAIVLAVLPSLLYAPLLFLLIFPVAMLITCRQLSLLLAEMV